MIPLRPSLARLVASSLCTLVPVGTASAQKILGTHYGDVAQGNLGWSVAIAGDVNQDGYDDVVAGEPGVGAGVGRVRVWSGADGALLYVLPAPAGGSFGFDVDGAGDTDGDGYADLLVGAPTAGAGGEAYVFSGFDGSLLRTLLPAGLSAHGTSVAGVGDLDGDGLDDVVVGDPADKSGPNGTAGAATAYSGATGGLLFVWYGDSHVDRFGEAVGAAGDVNADGRPDVIVGAVRDDPNGSASGSARVLSGADGSVLHTFDGTSAGDEFGAAVDGAGDVDGDGFADLIVGAGDAPYARVFSGSTGAVLHEFLGDTDLYGISVAGAGDLNADGFDDVVVGDPTTLASRPAVRAFSGLDGSLLFDLYSDDDDGRYGQAVGAGGDVNADGMPDFVIGAFGDDDGSPNAGSIQIVGAAVQIGVRYCSPAVPNSTGAPGILTAWGSPVVALNCVTLRVDDLPPNQFGFFLTSLDQGNFHPPGSSGVLCLAGNIGRFNQPKQIFRGFSAALQIDLTAIPQSPPVAIHPGETWNFQAWYRDGTTNNFTDAVTVTFQ